MKARTMVTISNAQAEFLRARAREQTERVKGVFPRIKIDDLVKMALDLYMKNPDLTENCADWPVRAAMTDQLRTVRAAMTDRTSPPLTEPAAQPTIN